MWRRIDLGSLLCRKGKFSDPDPIDVPCVVDNIDANTNMARNGDDRPVTRSTHAELDLTLTLHLRLPMIVGATAATGPLKDEWLRAISGQDSPECGPAADPSSADLGVTNSDTKLLLVK
jgi:hypothetical protein